MLGFYLCIYKRRKSVYICLISMDSASCPGQMLQRDVGGKDVLCWEWLSVRSFPRMVLWKHEQRCPQTTEIYPKRTIFSHSVSVLCIISYNSLKIDNLEMLYIVVFYSLFFEKLCVYFLPHIFYCCSSTVVSIFPPPSPQPQPSPLPTLWFCPCYTWLFLVKRTQYRHD